MTAAPPLGEAGQRLLPVLVDEIAATDPNRVLFSVCKTKDPADGFQDITFREFGQAVNLCAWYIHESLGRGTNFPTLAYIGPQDVMYAVLILASVKAGYKLLLNSPRNPLAAHLSLLDETGCDTFLLPLNFPLPVVKDILATRSMRVLEIAPLSYWIQDGPHRPYPYNKVFSEARLDPFVVLHTSGSTGMPKPIVQTHGTQAPQDSFTTLPDQGLPPTYPAMCTGKRVYLAFPLFHCAGVSMLLPGAIYSRFSVVLGPFPPSAEIVNGIHVHGRVQHSCLTPMTMMDLSKTPDYLDNLGRLEQITYGGGPCPVAVGNLIAEKCKLLNCLGTTECGVLPAQLCDQKDWSYMSVSPALGHEYRLVSDGLYEQVIVRRQELDLYQGIFCTFPELQEWPTKDLYSRHPTKGDQWLYLGRTDDIIVFSTGEKLNPIDIESIMNGDHRISAALIAGQGRIQSSLLLEVTKPPTNAQEASALLDEIWPVVETANRTSPSYGRVYRHMITFTSAAKPMLRAGKGTVQRKLTLDLYDAELAALYEKSNAFGNSRMENRSASGPKLQSTIRSFISSSTGIDINKLDLDADLFEYGLDSLQVLAITKQVNNLLAAYGKPAVFEAKTIYANSNLSNLIASILAFYQVDAPVPKQKEVTVNALFERFAADMPISGRQPEPTTSGKFIFLLTGSTGYLGSYILDVLTKDSRVSHIYCLNRGPDGWNRQQKSQLSNGLAPLTDSQVTFVKADLAKPYLGLSKEQYTKLLTEVTNVIHNAWQVDFNLSLSSYTGHIVGVKRLIEFSVHSRVGAKLFFVSSISTVSNAASPVQEQIHRVETLANGTGYSKSKLVAEILIDDAARHSAVSAMVCRVGQIAGPLTTGGVWPKKEWFPSLVAGSRYLGKVPAQLGPLERVDWVPVDILSRIVGEIATLASAKEDVGATVVHVVNPKPTSWSKLLPAVKELIGSVETVSLQAWVDALHEEVQAGDAVENPAIKLYDFYRDLASVKEEIGFVETAAAIKLSSTLRSLDSIKASWIKRWLGAKE